MQALLTSIGFTNFLDVLQVNNYEIIVKKFYLTILGNSEWRKCVFFSIFPNGLIPVGNFRLWDILLLNLPPLHIGFTNCFGCLIFDLSFFTNADVDETPKENS